MNPTNNKVLFHFLFSQMEKLDKKEIDTETAKAQANLGKQVNNAMKYELDRANMKIKISQHNKENNDNIMLRELEGKNFENTNN